MASPVPASGSSPNGSTPQGSSQNTSASARRTRSVGTKLSDEEYAQLESLAAVRGVTPGEWVRELVLAAFGKPAAGRSAAGKPATEKPAAEATVAEQTVLSEVLALRTILINIIYDQANGHEIAPERMRELIAKADDGKVEKAIERLKQNIRER
jgi:hypothetical protein